MDAPTTIGMLHLMDHWQLMLKVMAGDPLPELPAQPGTVHRRLGDIPEADAYAEAWDREHSLPDSEGGSHD